MVQEVDQEYWRIISRAPNYAVSDIGNVMRIAVGRRTSPGHLCKPHNSQRGYPVVVLFSDGKRIQRTVHSLVAEAFIGPRPEGKEVNHRDGIKINNAVGNLEYITEAENKQHSWDIGLRERKFGSLNPMFGRFGEQHPTSRLTEKQVLEIRRLRGKVSYREFARQFGVNPRTIKLASTGMTWGHL